MKSNVLIQGDIGTGKTRSLMTLLPEYVDELGRTQRGAGLDRVALISMEAGAEATLGRNICSHAESISTPIHQMYIPASAVSWDVVESFVKLANTLPIDNLIKVTDPNKRSYMQFAKLFAACRDFTCDHCGVNLGDVSKWDSDDEAGFVEPGASRQLHIPSRSAIAIDSLTGLTKAAIQNLVGGKPIRSLPEIGIIMEFIEAFLDLFWGGTSCSAILLAHIDREVSPITGLSTTTVHTIGQKLAPRIVKKPDEVISSHYHNGRYYWSTEPSIAAEVQKRRRLPISDSLVADFSQIFA